MTAGPTENASAAATQAKGESAARQHEADALAQHQASGSAVAVEAAAGPDDTAVQWTQPHGVVSGPTPDNSDENRSPNVDSPYDNRQSQG